MIFCGVLVAGAAAVALYLGPNVFSFLFHAERSSAPFVMVDFIDFTDVAGHQRDLDEYTEPAMEVVAEAGGRLLWQGRVKRVIAGRPDDLWDALVLVGYPSRQRFIDMVTSQAYREVASVRSQAVRRSAVMAATPIVDFAADFSADDHASCALLLHRFVDEDARDAYYEEYLPAQLEFAKDAGGVVIWRATTNPLFTGANFAWTDLIFLSFESEYHLSEWAHHPLWRSRQALARPLMERWALVEVEPAAPIP